jgi:hypothetical protein
LVATASALLVPWIGASTPALDDRLRALLRGLLTRQNDQYEPPLT